jgi:4-amino-4-deoxy-L-arabinose transferase-like glycosyltransferase
MAKNFFFDRSLRISVLLLLLIISAAVSVISTSLSKIEFVSGADESYYLKYAGAIGEKGLSVFPELCREYIAAPRNWVFPNPLRAGFIILSGLWLKAFGCGFAGLANLSLFSYCLFLIVSFYFCRKYFGNIFALLLSMLLASSPLMMAVSRRALMDSTANLFSLLSLWLFFDYINKRTNPKLLLFASAFACAILIKETSVLLSFIFISWLLCVRFIYKKEVRVMDFLWASVIPFFAVGIVYAVLGILPYLPRLIQIIISSPSTNPYAILYGSGPWFRYIIDYLLISPLILILALGFIFYYLVSRERERSEAVVYFLLVFVSLLFLFEFFTKNVRYVMLLDYPLRIFALFMLIKITQRYSSAKNAVFLIILVSAFAVFDCLNFYALFVKEGVYDPVSFALLKAQQIIP